MILERLDKVYVTVDWMNTFPTHYVHHEPILVSNHAAIVYISHTIPTKRPYQIESWCLTIDDVRALMQAQWATHHHAWFPNVFLVL